MAEKKKKPVRPGKRTWKQKLKFALILLWLLAVAGAGAASAAAVVYYIQADVSELSRSGQMPTIVYDRFGKVHAELSNSRVDFVDLTKIPEEMRQAIVAIEDARFYDHYGVDLIGIARAAVENIRRGNVTQGGSTITQQLAKNRFLTAERTFSRKIKEAIMAIKIERHYSKDQILEQYLNSIYFGEGAWGIQNAAEIYFGKDVEQLTLAESALLAGVLKAPSHYSPFKDPERALNRRNLVLNKMYEYGMIEESELNAALNEEIVVAEKTADGPVFFSSYVDHVIEEAIEKTGLTEQEVLSGGLHIYTHLDPKAQDAAEYVYLRPEYFPENKGGLQSGFVLLDSRSGGIRALVGQIGEKKHHRGFNFATQTRRQPGSAIKPLVSYAPALMEGYRSNDMIQDVPTNFGDYTPSNYGGRYHGWVTLEESLVRSLNVPAVALLREIGIDKGMELARAAGLPLTNEDRTLAVALGGLSRGVSPLNMAQAYTMFANNGVWSEAHAITEIFDYDGRLLYRARPNQKQLITPETAYEMTLMMQKVVTQGTGTQARMDRPVAGKTGTTQLPDTPEFRDANGRVIEGTRDAWFVGYTPGLTAAIWLGYPNTDRDHYLTTTGGRYPALIFKEVMERALAGEPIEEFVAPPGYKAPQGPIKYINGVPPIRSDDNGDEPEPDESMDEEELSEDEEERDEENGEFDENEEQMEEDEWIEEDEITDGDEGDGTIDREGRDENTGDVEEEGEDEDHRGHPPKHEDKRRGGPGRKNGENRDGENGSGNSGPGQGDVEMNPENRIDSENGNGEEAVQPNVTSESFTDVNEKTAAEYSP